MCDKTFEALTEKTVATLSDISFKEQNHIVYEMKQGTAISFTLLKNDDTHVLHSFLSAGSIFPLHNHEASAETLVLESGNVTVMCDDQGCDPIRNSLQVGVPMWIPEGMNHFLHAKEDSWILSVIIPPDKGMLK